jgi:hypothetical protein
VRTLGAPPLGGGGCGPWVPLLWGEGVADPGCLSSGGRGLRTLGAPPLGLRALGAPPLGIRALLSLHCVSRAWVSTFEVVRASMPFLWVMVALGCPSPWGSKWPGLPDS